MRGGGPHRLLRLEPQHYSGHGTDCLHACLFNRIYMETNFTPASTLLRAWELWGGALRGPGFNLRKAFLKDGSNKNRLWFKRNSLLQGNISARILSSTLARCLVDAGSILVRSSSILVRSGSIHGLIRFDPWCHVGSILARSLVRPLSDPGSILGSIQWGACVKTVVPGATFVGLFGSAASAQLLFESGVSRV